MLIYVERWLGRYSHAHKIDVLIGYPNKPILLRPEKLGLLEKWAMNMGEHDIDYWSCTDIKAQELVEFLLKIPDTLKNVPTVLPINPS